MGLRLKKRIVREIAGSWIDFRHPNDVEGEHWNEAVRGFSARDWEEKVREMAALGIDTLALGSPVLSGKSFYPSAVVSERWDNACEDPIEAILGAADGLAIEVFVGAGQGRENEGLAKELYERYGSHRSFHGWTLSLPPAREGGLDDGAIAALNQAAARCRAVDERRPILVSVEGGAEAEAEDRLVAQMQKVEADHLVYRDGVGMRRNEPADLAELFGKLARVHEKVDLPLWGSVELFACEGLVGESALIPAPFTRVKTQIEALSPHVKKLFCHQYLGMMNPGASTAFAGHTATATLHYDYHEWRCEQGSR